MPPKKRPNLSEFSHRRASKANAKRVRLQRNVDGGVSPWWGPFFPLFLASRPRPDRFRRLRPRPRGEARAPPRTPAPQVPRRRPRRLLHRRVTAKPPPPPLRLPRRNLPRPTLRSAPSLPRRPAASRVWSPEPRRQPRCGVGDPRCPCVGRGRAALPLGLTRPCDARRAQRPCPLQRHDPDTDDEEGDRAGGDAGSEGLDADAEADAEAAAAAAAEAADYDWAEEWGGDAGGDSGGGGAPYRAAGDDGTAATPPWAAAQG